MKTIYIDSDFKCHVSDDDAMAAVKTDVFDGKCDTYIEGFRFVPAGKNSLDQLASPCSKSPFFSML